MRLQTLLGELEAMKMNDSKDVSSYITRVQWRNSHGCKGYGENSSIIDR